MNFFYRKVAVWTTERENHRTDTVFEDTLIAKLAVFQVGLLALDVPRATVKLLKPAWAQLWGRRGAGGAHATITRGFGNVGPLGYLFQHG